MSYAEGEGNREKQRIIFNISVVLHLAIAVVVAILLYAAAPFLFGHFLNIPEGRILPAGALLGHDRQHGVQYVGRSL